MTKREQIVQAIIGKIGNISKEQGYNFTVGGEANVRRCLSLSELQIAPLAVVWEMEETRSRTSYEETKKILVIRIEIAVKTEVESCYDANRVLADIERAILPCQEDDELWNLVENIYDTKAEIARPQPGILITGAAIEFSVHYATPVGIP